MIRDRSRAAVQGSERSALPGCVLKESLTLVVAGIAIGIPLALAATRLIASRLFGVGASDPANIAIAILLLLTVAALAGFLPAWRASKVNPMVALRYE